MSEAPDVGKKNGDLLNLAAQDFSLQNSIQHLGAYELAKGVSNMAALEKSIRHIVEAVGETPQIPRPFLFDAVAEVSHSDLVGGLRLVFDPGEQRPARHRAENGAAEQTNDGDQNYQRMILTGLWMQSYG